MGKTALKTAYFLEMPLYLSIYLYIYILLLKTHTQHHTTGSLGRFQTVSNIVFSHVESSSQVGNQHQEIRIMFPTMGPQLPAMDKSSMKGRHSAEIISLSKGSKGQERATFLDLQCPWSGWWLTYPSEKYARQLGWLFPIYGKIKFMFQTTNQWLPNTACWKWPIFMSHDCPIQIRSWIFHCHLRWQRLKHPTKHRTVAVFF